MASVIVKSKVTSKPARPRSSTKPLSKPRAVPRYVEPMKALGVTEIAGDDWLLEIKYDGFRALGILQGKTAELWSRNEKPLTSTFPEVAAALARLKCEAAIVDGEVVALDEAGRPRFQLLQGLDMGKSRPPIHYFVFDVLHLNGESLLNLPIEDRRSALERLMKGVPDVLRLSPVFDVPPAKLLERAREQGLEGIIGKKKGTLYEPGRRSGAWVKRRISFDQEFVIGGYTPPQGGRTHFGALVVGYYEDGRLHYAGKVGTGFNAKLLKSLAVEFAKLETKQCPFVDLPRGAKPRYGLGMTAAAMREVTWLHPKLVAQVKFSEWTRDGLLRQPVFLGLRSDKRADEVVREIVS